MNIIDLLKLTQPRTHSLVQIIDRYFFGMHDTSGDLIKPQLVILSPPGASAWDRS